MHADATDPEALSVGEFVEMLHGLSDAQWVRIDEISRHWARVYAAEGNDLRNEAVCRVLQGTRRCPRDVDPVAFFARTMRGIACDRLRASRRNLPIDHATTDKNGKSVPFDISDNSANAEEVLADAGTSAAIEASILKLFEEDVAAQSFAEGVLAGFEGKELQEYTGLTGKAFASMRRHFRRTVDKRYPNGWSE